MADLTPDLTAWVGCDLPAIPKQAGTFVDVREIDLAPDIPTLFDALCGPENVDLWRYIPVGPFASADLLGSTVTNACEHMGWRTVVFLAPASPQILGMASYMRLRPEHGSAEVGCVVFSKALQRTPAATEAMYLMASHLFDDLGYRRYEWKCNNRNDASKTAALRFGFTFEGVFRNDMVVKGDNRDTAWFSMTDAEWPAIKQGFQDWLDPGNFDSDGQQVKSLASLREG
jgi:RimJ/RimL family protein N-acetyltransferase